MQYARWYHYVKCNCKDNYLMADTLDILISNLFNKNLGKSFKLLVTLLTSRQVRP